MSRLAPECQQGAKKHTEYFLTAGGLPSISDGAMPSELVEGIIVAGQLGG
jgi:hypothetical protein